MIKGWKETLLAQGGGVLENSILSVVDLAVRLHHGHQVLLEGAEKGSREIIHAQGGRAEEKAEQVRTGQGQGRGTNSKREEGCPEVPDHGSRIPANPPLFAGVPYIHPLRHGRCGPKR